MLMRTLKKLNIKKVYDLQNSSRTKFYKNILFPKANLILGLVQKLPYQVIFQKKNLIKTQF